MRRPKKKADVPSRPASLSRLQIRSLTPERWPDLVRLFGERGACGGCGARIVEGYPVEPRRGSMPDAFAWTGTASAFRRAGFVEVLRRSATRPIMRFVVGGDSR